MKGVLKRLFPDRTRHILVHMHYFKNAGTTVDWALRHSFGGNFGTTDNLDDAGYQYSSQEVEQYLQSHPQLSACSSHQFRLPFPQPRGMRLHPFTFVRHPIDRVFSVYAFEQKQGVVTPGSRKAAGSPIEEYLEWRLGSGEYSVIHNFHVSTLLRTEGDELPSVPVSDLARQRWKTLALGGVVERLDESLVLLEERVRPWFPEINLAYVRQNTAKGRAASLEERVEKGLETLPKELAETLLKQNQLDLAFYDWAVKQLEEELAGVPDLEKKLDAFRDRCGSLQS